MKKYIIKNEFVSIGLYLEDDINIDLIKYYLGNYVSITEYNDELLDYELIFIYGNTNSELPNVIDNHHYYSTANKMFFNVEHNINEAIFIKRVIIDVVNRIFERKGGFFLHASSVVDDKNTSILFGKKGVGKTTNMLYLLSDSDLKYSSNERSGIILCNGIKTYGNPARINIRANTLAGNEELQKKLTQYIDMKEYQRQIELHLPCDCSERFVFNIHHISKSLDVDIEPFGYLKNLIHLKNADSNNFKIEEVGFEDIKNDLNEAVIPGVFPIRQEINDIIPANPYSLELLNNESIHFYNVYHDNKNNYSGELLKLIRKGN